MILDENGWHNIDVRGLPARLHNDPNKIVPTLSNWISKARKQYGDRIVIGFGDCGTGGGIDRLCAQEGLIRLPGPHCFSFLSGNDAFESKQDANATTFYLTDFLVDHFETLVIRDLWLNRNPELKSIMFEHYEKLVYLAQSDDPNRTHKAERLAEWLDLTFERQVVGHGDLETLLRRFA